MGVVDRVIQEIERVGLESLTRVISFDAPTLQHARDLSGHARLGLDFSGRLLPVRRALALGAETLLPYWPLASRRLIRRAHREELQVIPWTVNYHLHMRRKILDGVDGVITNYPARLTEVLQRIEQERAKG